MNSPDEKVYFPKNHFLREDVLDTYGYLDHFYPFGTPDFHKNGRESMLNITDKMEVGIAPTYHIELRDKPVIVWDFYSLHLILQMLMAFMHADEASAIKMCKKCGKAFLPTRKGNELCSMRCKNQYNVYKTRAKKSNRDA